MKQRVASGVGWFLLLVASLLAISGSSLTESYRGLGPMILVAALASASIVLFYISGYRCSREQSPELDDVVQ